MFTFINALTLSRIVGAPLLLWPWYVDTPWVWATMSGYFIILSLTDFFDGFLARKYHLESDFGKLIDPIGDKILVLFALVVLTMAKDLSPYFLLIFITRDFIINGLRAFASGIGMIIAAKPLGKIKAALQMVAIPMLFFPDITFLNIFISLHVIGWWILLISLIFAIISAVDYFLSFKKLWVDRLRAQKHNLPS